MRLKQPCLAAVRAEQVVAKRVAEQGVAADGLRAWEVAVAALLASPKAAWNMRGIDSGTGPQLNAMPLGRHLLTTVRGPKGRGTPLALLDPHWARKRRPLAAAYPAKNPFSPRC
jgi:hypothetical protein